jgi:hypothetical protein
MSCHPLCDKRLRETLDEADRKVRERFGASLKIVGFAHDSQRSKRLAGAPNPKSSMNR